MARILDATLRPCSRLTGARPAFDSCPTTSLSSRRSILVPTTIRQQQQHQQQQYTQSIVFTLETDRLSG